MSTSAKSPGERKVPGATATEPGHNHKLKAGAVGLVGVLFMAVANAAPITAMTGNVPIAIGYGNGLGAPAGFLVATIVLTLFAIGFVAMAKHITTAGAFYGFITHGLGQVWGMASGLLATMAYVVFEGSLIGIFSYFTHFGLDRWFGWDTNWLVLALIGVVIVALFGYFDISIAAAFLGITLVLEVVLLGALGFAVLFSGGGPDGLLPEAVNPINAFTALPAGGGVGLEDLAAGSAAIGLFFAFWSWVGFETTAAYGEESRDPKTIVPRATILAVVGLGTFYTFVSWMMIAGNGKQQAIELSAAGDLNVWVGLAEDKLGGSFIGDIYVFLIIIGSFACALAFHNAASRYIYAIGRELPATRDTLGRTHGTHGTPHVASLTQSGITVLLTLCFYFLASEGGDPLMGAFIYQYGLLAILGTMAILIVQAIASFAVISYFHVKKEHPGSMVTTGVIPLLGGIGMLFVVYLLISNLEFAGGLAAESPFFSAIPWIVVGVFVIGLVSVLALRSKDPATYARIGRTVMEETHVRDETTHTH